ncbi:DUF6869 domain-containing protein [Pseudomonas sp. EA_35y_Pfl2_R111]|uniref:DUF6869 domain-containing protein n=1 Tax=Pseudomonas sp. EA_35y_Pfl2_R111 TaxID=3088689 RepID=UPI0030DC5110
MDRAEILRIAEKWISYYREYELTGKLLAGGDELNELVYSAPKEALEIVFEILSKINQQPENSLFQQLAAGPMEMLLVYQGDTIIELVEHEAARSAEFRLLLGGVWQSTTHENIWQRVLQSRSQAW